MSSHNLMTALSLASSGFHVFPCKGVDGDEGKVPLVAWRGDSTTDPDKIGRLWTQWPAATVGLDVGKSGLFVVDCDKPKAEGQADGRAWFEAFLVEHGAEAGNYVTCTTPSGGVHYIFRAPEGEPLGNGRGGLPKKKDVAIDVRGQGGFIIAPNSVMQDGRTYVLNGDLADVAPPPECVVAILRAKQPEPEPLPSAGLHVVSVPASPGRVGAYSSAGFESEVNEVRTAPKGARNDTLNTSAFKLGTMVGAGWVTEADATAALIGAVAGWENQRKTIDTLKRGVRDGMAHPRGELPDELGVDPAAMVAPLLKRYDSEAAGARLVEQADGAIFDNTTGEVVGGEGEVARNKSLTLFPGLSLLVPGRSRFPAGLVGQIALWIIQTSRRPQPMLALGSALAIVGTALGQRVYGPTGSSTALYVLGLAPTGAGKDRPLKACVGALGDAGLERLIGPGEFISMPAVINSLVSRPVSLAAMDEFGSFLKRINNKRASGFEASIGKALRTFWSAGFERIMTPEWAGREREMIFAPSLSIFGVSTPDEFLESVASGDVKNGTLNRFLVLPMAGHVRDRKPAVESLRLPDELVAGLRRLRGEGAGNVPVDVCAPAMPDGVPPLKLGWEDAFAERVWTELITARMDEVIAGPDGKGGEDADFIVRVAEQAIRVATIIAAGRGADTVDLPDLLWGFELAARSADALMTAFRSHVPTSDHAERLEFVEQVIRKEGTISRSRLTNLTRRRVDRRQLDGILAMDVEAGKVVAEIARKGTRGPETIAYRWLG